MKTLARSLRLLIRGISLGFFFLGLILCLLCKFSGEAMGWKIPVLGITGGVIYLIQKKWDCIRLNVELIAKPPLDED